MGIPSADEIIDYTDENELYENRVFEEIRENANVEEIGFENISDDDLNNTPEEPNF